MDKAATDAPGSHEQIGTRSSSTAVTRVAAIHASAEIVD